MRAKKVYENINFERNKDPKKIMDLGYPESLEEIYTYVDKKIQTLEFVHLQREFALCTIPPLTSLLPNCK